MEWKRVCGMDELPAEEGRGLALEFEDVRLALFRVGDQVRVISGRCPHSGGILGKGWVEEGEAVCPLHRWQFRLDTGRCTTIRGESVRVFECEAREEGVFVRL